MSTPTYKDYRVTLYYTGALPIHRYEKSAQGVIDFCKKIIDNPREPADVEIRVARYSAQTGKYEMILMCRKDEAPDWNAPLFN